MSLFQRLTAAIRNVDDYIAMMVQVLRDGEISQAEMGEIKRISMKLRMSEQDIHVANVRVLEYLVNGIASDGLVSPEELNTIQKVASMLGVPIHSMSAQHQSAIAAGAQMQSIADGNLPVIHSASLPIRIPTSEVVHLATPCTVYQEKTIARRSTGGYGGVRFRIARGVSVGVGGYRGHSVPITATMRVAEGLLLLTSFGTRFFADSKGFQKPWSKVVGVEPYSDAVTFFFSDRTSGSTLHFNDVRAAPFVEAICLAKLS